MEKPKKVPLNRLVLPETFEKVKELAVSCDLTDGAVVDRAVRMLYAEKTGAVEVVSEGLSVAQIADNIHALTGTLNEMLELVRDLPDREDVKQVVIEAGNELRGRQQGVPTPVPHSSRFVEAPSVPFTGFGQPQSDAIDLEVLGVSVGMPPKDLPKNCQCVHCPRRFAGPRFANLCPDCVEQGHRGDVRECTKCGDYGTGAL